MFEPLIIERFANRPNATVHHVARANEISASASLNHRLFTKLFDRLVIQHDSVLTHNPVMAITGIGIQGNVRHDRHLRNGRFDLANRTGN